MFDNISTDYTNITHSKLKDRLRELVQLCFMKKNTHTLCKEGTGFIL